MACGIATKPPLTSLYAIRPYPVIARVLTCATYIDVLGFYLGFTPNQRCSIWDLRILAKHKQILYSTSSPGYSSPKFFWPISQSLHSSHLNFILHLSWSWKINIPHAVCTKMAISDIYKMKKEPFHGFALLLPFKPTQNAKKILR